MSLRFYELPVGAVVPWKGVRWTVAKVAEDALTLLDPATGKRRRMTVLTREYSSFGREMEALWALTRPHCYGMPQPCFWCAWGLGGADSARGGGIATMQWHDD